jgi:hypothetical protein
MANNKRITRRIWKPDEIRKIATTYCIEGTIKGTSRKTKCPESTIRDFRDKNNEHWDEAIVMYRDLKKDQYVSMADAIIDKAGKVALEKLDECDARSAAIVGGVYYDKRQVALQLPSSYKDADTVNQLAQRFADLSQEQARLRANQEAITNSVVNTNDDETHSQ